MPEENEKEELDNNEEEESLDNETEKDNQEEEGKKKGLSAILSPEGIIMISIGVLLDLASLICVFLIMVFGIGLVLAKVVYFLGLIIITTWTIIRSGSLPGKDKVKEKIAKGLKDFFKKHWKRIAGKSVPAIGDALPLWTITIYSELTDSKLISIGNLFGKDLFKPSS